MKLRAVFTKVGDIKFISHLDLVRLFQRAFNRAGIPVIYSEGFNPHPKFSIGNPLSLGVESEIEYLDIEIEDDYKSSNFIEDLNPILPQGVKILSATEDFEDISVSRIIKFSKYEFKLNLEEQLPLDIVAKEIDDFMQKEEIIAERKKKKGRKKILVSENIREKIINLISMESNNDIKLIGIFTAGELNNLRPDVFLEALINYTNLKIDQGLVEVKRLENYDWDMNKVRWLNGLFFHRIW